MLDDVPFRCKLPVDGYLRARPDLFTESLEVVLVPPVNSVNIERAAVLVTVLVLSFDSVQQAVRLLECHVTKRDMQPKTQVSNLPRIDNFASQFQIPYRQRHRCFGIRPHRC